MEHERFQKQQSSPQTSIPEAPVTGAPSSLPSLPGSAGELADPAPRLKYLPARGSGDGPDADVTLSPAPPTRADIQKLFSNLPISGGKAGAISKAPLPLTGPEAGRFVPNDEAITSLSSKLVAASVTDKAEKAYAEKAIPLILKEAQARGISDPEQLAYILATAHHESRYGTPKYKRSTSLVEDENPVQHDKKGVAFRKSHVTGKRVEGDDENTYWDAAYGGKLGNQKGTADAADFRGRGFLQLTGRDNYQNWTDRLKKDGYSYTADGVKYGGTDGQPIDLLAHPEHVNKVPELASRILVEGMQEGAFHGAAETKGGPRVPQKLASHINDRETDYYKARDIINGDKAHKEGKNKEDNGTIIQNYAETYANILKAGNAWQAIVQPKTDAAGGTPTSGDRTTSSQER